MSVYGFDGGDGTGKTTISKRIAALLEKPWFKFPYGSDNDSDVPIYSGLEIRKILNDKENKCNPTAFQALQYVNKVEGNKVIKRLEEEHGVVFVDRTPISALVYGGVDGVDEVWNNILAVDLFKRLEYTAIFIFSGEPFKTDNDIYGDKQVKIREAYNKYYEAYINANEISLEYTPKLIKIDVTNKTEDQVMIEVLKYILSSNLTNQKKHNTNLVYGIDLTLPINIKSNQ